MVMMIDYSKDLNDLKKINIEGFFVGLPNPPSVERFKKILRGSYCVVLAIEGGKLAGFITAISDGVLFKVVFERQDNYEE